MTNEVKTLAVRLDTAQRTRLDMLARLTGRTVTDLIREAIDVHVEQLRKDPVLAEKAQELVDRIQQDAFAQQAALGGMFESEPPPSSQAPKTSTSRSRKA